MTADSDTRKLLRKIHDTGLLYKHDLKLDAEVCNFLAAPAELQTGRCELLEVMTKREQGGGA